MACDVIPQSPFHGLRQKELICWLLKSNNAVECMQASPLFSPPQQRCRIIISFKQLVLSSRAKKDLITLSNFFCCYAETIVT